MRSISINDLLPPTRFLGQTLLPSPDPPLRSITTHAASRYFEMFHFCQDKNLTTQICNKKETLCLAVYGDHVSMHMFQYVWLQRSNQRLSRSKRHADVASVTDIRTWEWLSEVGGEVSHKDAPHIWIIMCIKQKLKSREVIMRQKGNRKMFLTVQYWKKN